MSKLKKVLLMCTAYVLVAALAIGGTVAYLQDSDSDVNVMTLGNVSIAQHEYERATNTNGSYETKEIDGVTSYVLKDFTQGKPLYPIVGDPNEPGNSPAYAGHDSTIVRMTQVDSYGSMQVFAGKNAQDKFVTVENTGKTDAYVRTLVAIENGTGDASLIGIGARCVPAAEADTSTAPWVSNYIGKITVDRNTYGLYEYVYRGASDVNRHVNGILPAGDTTYPSLCQVYLKHNATNEDMVAIDGNGNGTLDILVLSQAVQAAGFADAETALNAGFGDITTTNHPWTNATISSEVGITEAGTYDLKGDVYTIDSAYFHTQKVTDPVTINGNGATVEGVATSVDAFQWEGGTIPAMSAIFSSADGSKVTVNDLKFTGTMSSIMLGNYVNKTYNKFDTELNNVDVIGTKVVSFSNGVSPAVTVYGTAVLNNCNIYRTTLSKLDTDPMWPVYDLALTNYTTTTLNNSKVGSIYMWSHANVTIADGSEVDEMYTALIKGTVTVKSGAHVGTINVDYAERGLSEYATANYFKKIVVEDGATVDAIVYNGTSYTVAEWNAYVASL